jgi:epoxide hydrolase 4
VLAWALAMRAPEYVRRLVICNAPHPATFQRALYSPSQWLRSAYVGFFQLEGVAEEALARDDYALIRRTFRAADRERAWLTDADIQRYVNAIARPGALTAALSYYRQVVRRGPGIVGPARVIPAPTLVLWGELDSYIGVESLAGLERWVDDLRVQRFSTAGHWVNQQEPARTNEALLEFLR